MARLHEDPSEHARSCGVVGRSGRGPSPPDSSEVTVRRLLDPFGPHFITNEVGRPPRTSLGSCEDEVPQRLKCLRACPGFGSPVPFGAPSSLRGGGRTWMPPTLAQAPPRGRTALCGAVVTAWPTRGYEALAT